MTEKEWLKIGSKWETSSSKRLLLFPELDLIMGNISGKNILDAGCGDGIFVRRCIEKGANATGIDISDNTIKICREKDKRGDYFVGDIKKISLNKKFDYVLSSFVLLSFDKKKEIIKAIKNMKSLLKKNGKLIIAVPHPAFDNINENMDTMTRGFFEDYSYSKKGLKTLYKHKTKKFTILDFHWMIEDYIECIRESGLLIEDIREPIPRKESKKENSKLYEGRLNFPPMIIFVCKF